MITALTHMAAFLAGLVVAAIACHRIGQRQTKANDLGHLVAPHSLEDAVRRAGC